MGREEERAKLRASMPQTAAIVDEFKRVFGDGVRVRWATENGIEVGKKGPPGVPIRLEYRSGKQTQSSRSEGRSSKRKR